MKNTVRPRPRVHFCFLVYADPPACTHYASPSGSGSHL